MLTLVKWQITGRKAGMSEKCKEVLTRLNMLLIEDSPPRFGNDEVEETIAEIDRLRAEKAELMRCLIG